MSTSAERRTPKFSSRCEGDSCRKSEVAIPQGLPIPSERVEKRPGILVSRENTKTQADPKTKYTNTTGQLHLGRPRASAFGEVRSTPFTDVGRVGSR